MARAQGFWVDLVQESACPQWINDVLFDVTDGSAVVIFSIPVGPFDARVVSTITLEGKFSNDASRFMELVDMIIMMMLIILTVSVFMVLMLMSLIAFIGISSFIIVVSFTSPAVFSSVFVAPAALGEVSVSSVPIFGPAVPVSAFAIESPAGASSTAFPGFIVIPAPVLAGAFAGVVTVFASPGAVTVGRSVIVPVGHVVVVRSGVGSISIIPSAEVLGLRGSSGIVISPFIVTASVVIRPGAVVPAIGVWFLGAVILLDFALVGELGG